MVVLAVGGRSVGAIDAVGRLASPAFAPAFVQLLAVQRFRFARSAGVRSNLCGLLAARMLQSASSDGPEKPSCREHGN